MRSVSLHPVQRVVKIRRDCNTWVANETLEEWGDMITDPEYKIGCPRQIHIGAALRNVVPLPPAESEDGQPRAAPFLRESCAFFRASAESRDLVREIAGQILREAPPPSSRQAG